MRIHFVIIPIFLFSFAWSLQAQEQIPVFGDEYFCLGSCGQWQAEIDPDMSNQFIYSWVFSQGLGGPTGDTIYHTTTEVPSVVWCPEFEGPFDLQLTIYDANGNVIGTGGTAFFVEFFQVQIFGQGLGFYESACEQDSFGITIPDREPICREVCVGTRSSIGFSDLILSSTNGQTNFPYLSEQDWSVTGGEIVGYIDDRTGQGGITGVEVVWQEAGAGNISAVIFVESECGIVTETLNFCFDVTPAPDASFTTQPPVNPNGVLEICEGQTVFFTNTSEDAVSFLWDFGDDRGSSAENPQHTYTAAGTYEATLITTSSCECSDTTSVTVVVEGNDTPFIDCVATICEGTSITYTANTGCSSYDWTISGNGAILDGGQVDDDFITIQWGAGPIGEITLATAGCPGLSTCTAAAYAQVSIVSDNATITGPTRVCRGTQTVYEITPFTGTSYTWTVSPFGTIVAGQGTPSATIEWFDGPIPPSDQWVNVDYENCYLECGGNDRLTVGIRPDFYATGPIEVCELSTTQYSAINTQTNVAFPADYVLLAADGSTAWTGSGVTVNIDWTFGAGEYTLEVRPQQATDFCTEVYTQAISVPARPAPVATVDGQRMICPGIGYTYTVTDNNQGERYRWTVTNGGSSTEREGTSIAVVWGASGPYALTVARVVPPLECLSETTIVQIEQVNGFTISGDDQVCQDQTATYTSDQTGDVYYQWSISPAGAGTIAEDPTAATIDILWHTAGPAQVILDICGQQATFPVTVNATPQPMVNHPAALCPGVTAMVSTSINYSAYSWQDTVGVELSTSAMPELGPGYYRLQVTDALGCTGTTTFSIYGYPESGINITTPDPEVFCNVGPQTRMFAVNTTDGYTFQWYQDGSPIGGATTTQYTAIAFGNYWVEITDENGCTFNSNTINVRENCGGGGGPGGGGCSTTCPSSQHDITFVDTGDCADRSYQAVANGTLVSNVTWTFDDTGSGSSNIASGLNVTHTYREAGFYRVWMFATYDDGMGNETSCCTYRPDTIYAAADFDYDGVCPGLPVQFYDLSTFLDLTSITDWSWDFGDPTSGAANVSTDKDPVHTFTDQGTYTVTLTITTANGCTASIQKPVAIFPQPATTFAEPDASCAMASLTFIADVEPTVSDVLWNFGDPTSGDADNSSLFTTYHQYATAGAYLVNLEATSVYGCTNSFSRTITVTPNTLAGDISPAGVQTICAGDDVTLTAPGSVPMNWEWSNGATDAMVTISEAGAYTVTLTDDDGCVYSPAVVTVDVIPAPVSPIRAVEFDDFNQPVSFTYDTLFVCAGQDVYLETVQQAGYTYSWSTGGTTNTVSYTEERGNLLTTGTYDVSLTVTNTSNGCSAVEVFVVVVNPSPDTPVLDAGGSDLCAGNSTTITITNASNDNIYRWSSGENASSVTTTEPGDYFVTALNQFGCRTESDIVSILPGPDIDLVPSGCHTRCAPDTLCLPTIVDVVTYQWYQDGSPIGAPNGNVPELIISQTGSYTLEMTDVNNCTQTTNPLDVEILPGFGTIFGNVFYDTNDNNVLDAGDTPAEDIDLSADNGTGFSLTVTSSPNGSYGFVDIPEDGYSLEIDTLTVPTGWTPQRSPVDTSFVGCDQEVQLMWLLLRTCDFDTTFTAEVCAGEVFNFQNNDYLPGNTYIVQNTPTDGCDSTWTFTVNELAVSSDVLSVGVCPGQSYIYLGNAYPAGTDTTFTFMNSSGCDSLVQLQVGALPTSSEVLAVGVCPGAAYSYLGGQYPPGTDTLFVLTNTSGCDSLVQLQVGALPSSSEVLAVDVCPDETYSYLGGEYPPGTDTLFTLTNTSGCDSLVQLQVGALPSSSEVLAVDVCPDETYSYLGGQYPPGTDTLFTLMNIAGCDSLVQLQVSALPSSSEVLAVSVCPDETYSYLGREYPPGTDTTFTFMNTVGCDSLVQLQVSALPDGGTSSIVVNVCEDGTYDYQGQNYAPGTDTTFVFTSANGCDSLVQLQVGSLAETVQLLAIDVCIGDAYSYLGQAYNAGTDTVFTLTSSAGCDSLVQLQVSALPSASYAAATAESCPNAPSGSVVVNNPGGSLPLLYSLDGSALQASPQFEDLAAGTYQLTIEDAEGCMYSEQVTIGQQEVLSVTTLSDTVLPCDSASIMLQPIVQSGDDGLLSTQWNDGITDLVRSVSSSGTYELTVSNGCEQWQQSIMITDEINLENRAVYIPTAFSPNDDDVNDEFGIYPSPKVSFIKYDLQIFDRWGTQVFTSDNPLEMWPGLTKERKVESGVYVWRLTATVNNCGEETTLLDQGEVILVR